MEALKLVTHYRLISVINLISKIISKLLANRLSVRLPELILAHQTAFVRGRYISENFIAMREIVQSITESKKTGRTG